jgi:hypothetical protein
MQAPTLGRGKRVRVASEKARVDVEVPQVQPEVTVDLPLAASPAVVVLPPTTDTPLTELTTPPPVTVLALPSVVITGPVIELFPPPPSADRPPSPKRKRTEQEQTRYLEAKRAATIEQHGCPNAPFPEGAFQLQEPSGLEQHVLHFAEQRQAVSRVPSRDVLVQSPAPAETFVMQIATDNPSGPDFQNDQSRKAARRNFLHHLARIHLVPVPWSVNNSQVLPKRPTANGNQHRTHMVR